MVDSISQFVGIRHKNKTITDLKYSYIQEVSKKGPYESRKGAYCYMPEAEKIVGMNPKGQMIDLKLTSLIEGFKFPEFVTPIPYKEAFYLLDPAIFDKSTQTFIHDKNLYKVNEKC